MWLMAKWKVRVWWPSSKLTSGLPAGLWTS